jgi:hypothetical protein
MKRIVLTFGLIAGLITSATLVTMLLVWRDSGTVPENGEIIGYSSMLIAFITIFVGIKTYRDQNGGRITFGQGFKVGILITLVASTLYVATWQVYYYNFAPDFIEKYSARQLEKMRASGASPATLAEEKKKMEDFAKLYRNPLVNIGFSYMEIVPVGLIVTLIAAGVLRRKSPMEPVAA